jgi:hypothetical protein
VSRRSVNDSIMVPDSFWQSREVVAALRNRYIARLFELIQEHTGASQTQIGIACGMAQSTVSQIIHRIRGVEALAIFERVADGPRYAGFGPAQTGTCSSRNAKICHDMLFRSPAAAQE